MLTLQMLNRSEIRRDDGTPMLDAVGRFRALYA